MGQGKKEAPLMGAIHLPLRLARGVVVTAGGTAPTAKTAAPAEATAAATGAAEATALTAEAAMALLAGLGLGLVHADGTTVKVGAVQRLNGGIAFLGVGHLHKAEALGAARHAVGDHAGGGDLAVSGERRAETFVIRRVGKIADVNIHLDTFLTVAAGIVVFGGAASHGKGRTARRPIRNPKGTLPLSKTAIQ